MRVLRKVLVLLVFIGITTISFSIISGCASQDSFDAYIYSENDLLLLHQKRGFDDTKGNETRAYEFVRSRLSGKTGGVHTNYLDSSDILTHSTGHEILSESIGLMMLYAVKIDDKALFDEQFKLSVQALLEPTYLVRWRFRENDKKLSQASASIDDLRIARALVLGYTLWKDEKYLALLDGLSEDLLKYTISDGMIVNYYNHEIEQSDEIIDLSYIDLRTMAVLKEKNSRWEAIAENGQRIITNGLISDQFPMYHKAYNVKEERYMTEDSINILDALLTMLHLSEMGELNQASVDWIYAEFNKNGKLYSRYDLNGIPKTESESTAAYAILGRLAKTAGDDGLYNLAISRMNMYQVIDVNTPIYGGFGDKKTLEVYSYDNLQALLAY